MFKKLMITAAVLVTFGPHHARAGDVNESTKKYCIEYDKQTVTVTGMMLVRKVPPCAVRSK
jgi:hypothetical protein